MHMGKVDSSTPEDFGLELYLSRIGCAYCTYGLEAMRIVMLH